MNEHRGAGAAAQRWDARGYAHNARFVGDLGVPVVDLLAPRQGERILDLGCGDGVLSARVIACGATVVGVDSSPEFVAAARGAGIDARLMSGDALTFAAEFDAVFSNAALHWIPDADGVLRGVRRALKPGGRFVAEFGGQGNVAAIRTGLRAVLQRRGLAVRDPWYFPTAQAYGAKLESHGFAVLSCVSIARPTPLPTGLRGWLETFAHPFVDGLAAPDRGALLDEVIELVAPALQDDFGRWTADYVRLRFAAMRV